MTKINNGDPASAPDQDRPDGMTDLSPLSQKINDIPSVASMIAADQSSVEIRQKGSAYRFTPIKPNK